MLNQVSNKLSQLKVNSVTASEYTNISVLLPEEYVKNRLQALEPKQSLFFYYANTCKAPISIALYMHKTGTEEKYELGYKLIINQCKI